VGIAWIGYDQPKNLGNRETGGGLALPIWIGYMGKALKGEEMVEREVPPGLVLANGEYYYAETPPGTGVATLDVGPPPAPAEQKQRDAVRNELFCPGGKKIGSPRAANFL
jgi:penicillin-binding protein 1A